MFNLDRSKNDTSVTLDLLRAVAAQMVCVGHAISFAYGWQPARLPLMQNVGVLLFFMLSGFLITYTLIERSKNPDYGFGQFFIERFARIYSGLIPALALVVVVDGITIYLTGDQTIARYYGLPTFLVNLVMFEDYRGSLSNYDALQWSAFGSASPLWTLAIEWHIYLFVAAVYFIGARMRSIPLLIVVAIVFGQMPAHYLIGALSEAGVGRGLFTLWLGGCMTYFAMQHIKPAYWPMVAVSVLAALAFSATTAAGAEYSFRGYAILLVFFLAFMLASQARRVITSQSVNRAIQFFADYSFSLYLVHHTIMISMWTIFSVRGLPFLVVAIVLSNILAIGLAQIGEKHHRKLAQTLLQWRQSTSKISPPAAS